MKVAIGKHELEMGGEYLTELRSSNDIFDDTESLRQRLKEDGYLLIRGFHDRDQVMKARTEFLGRLQRMGRLAEGSPPEDGIIGPGNRGAFFGSAELHDEFPAFLELVNGQHVINFFDRLLGGKSITYDYKWPRAVGTGEFTGAHYDIVYMGRGTKNLYTMWTPLGDTPVEMGTLALLLGSQHFDRIRQTYGEMDVDRDNVEKGWFSEDALELIEKYGGKWATTPFQAGDMIVFGMFMMHGSTNNVTNRYRLSSDTRYQLDSEPKDERWVGVKPKGHYAWGKGKTVSIEEARSKWGV